MADNATMGAAPVVSRATAIEYCAPAVVFAVLTAVEGYLPLAYYPAAYAVKAIAVTLTLYACRRILADIVPSWALVLPSVLVGAAVFALWVGVELWLDYPRLGSRVGYDPFDALSPANARAFLAVRLYGLILLVPVFEELLWRSFLIRYATTTADFRSSPPWAFSMTAFWIVAIAAAVSHTEWLVAFAANAIYLLWMRRTRSVFAAVVAHATTNAMLGVFILLTGYWIFW
jgi:CAAX prenyl protease-like protein